MSFTNPSRNYCSPGKTPGMHSTRGGAQNAKRGKKVKTVNHEIHQQHERKSKSNIIISEVVIYLHSDREREK